MVPSVLLCIVNNGLPKPAPMWEKNSWYCSSVISLEGLVHKAEASFNVFSSASFLSISNNLTGYEIWSEYFLTTNWSLVSSKNSLASFFNFKVIDVPAVSLSVFSKSNPVFPSEDHFQACSSPAFFYTTSTLSATIKEA